MGKRTVTFSEEFKKELQDLVSSPGDYTEIIEGARDFATESADYGKPVDGVDGWYSKSFPNILNDGFLTMFYEMDTKNVKIRSIKHWSI